MITAYVDLDGTLLKDDNTISNNSIKILEKFISKGNNIVFATARSSRLTGVPDVIKSITPYFILHNGSELLSYSKTVKRFFFDVNTTRKIGNFLTLNKIKASVILDNIYFANYDAQRVWGKIENFSFSDFSDISVPAPKFSILISSPTNDVNVLNMLQNIADIKYLDEGRTAIVTPLNVSKGNAVIEFEKCFCSSQTIFFGNDVNDISGFRACTIGVAVSNADAELLRYATFVTKSNNDDGVAIFLKQYL